MWASVGHTTKVQGWKLHLSSIPTEAVSLLWRVSASAPAQCQFQNREGRVGAFSTERGRARCDASREIHDRIPPFGRRSRRTGRCTSESDERVSRAGDHVSDLRLGNIVYTRYGAFNPIVTRDRLGQMFLSIHAPDGTLRVDVQQVPFSPPEGVSNPFAASSGRGPVQNGRAATAEGPCIPSALFGSNYLVLEVIRHQAKGSIFRAIDLRSQAQVISKSSSKDVSIAWQTSTGETSEHA